MTFRHLTVWLLVAALTVPGAGSLLAQQQQQQAPPFEPRVGQQGKDVVWVPTPAEMVERMLDLAAVTPQDFVVDLGSGDGRNVIGAARRGARALGVEYNPDMVALSRYNANVAGVADRATFVEGDMFEADFSKATVLVLFLLPDNLRKLREKFLELQPGARIVANTFGIDDWTPEETRTMEGNCTSWCTMMLYVVPARVAGTWETPNGVLRLTQEVQVVSGTLERAGSSVEVTGRLLGTEITLTAGDQSFTGQVNGNRITGTWQANGRRSNWEAARVG